ncbi:MAG: hypothetical protein ABIK28_08225 [Planctomycetota bacterium]
MKSVKKSTGTQGGMNGFIVSTLFVLLACWFLWGFDTTPIPESPAARVNKADLSIAPRRIALSDPPIIHLNGYDRNCMDCHMLFPPRAEPPESLAVHSHIIMNHGMNDQCRNCHDLANRNRLVMQNRVILPFSQSAQLCGKCHGPTYRDWERGMHGRSQGFWNRSLGELIRLRCVDCHDPHSPRVPAMVPMKPLPSPHTLRMGTLREEHDSAEESDPLRRTIMRGSRNHE